MATKADASQKIDDYVDSLPEFSRAICQKLRQLIHKGDKQIIEDWKWGPNFNKAGMVCGFGAFKGWVTLTFFQGFQMTDSQKLFNYGDHNAHNRSIKFTNPKEIDQKAIIAYVVEAIAINERGSAVGYSQSSDKEIKVPSDFQKALKEAKLLDNFAKSTYTLRKEYVEWIENAKRDITRLARIQKALAKLKTGETLYAKYRTS